MAIALSAISSSATFLSEGTRTSISSAIALTPLTRRVARSAASFSP
jgi:hypothetical protein